LYTKRSSFDLCIQTYQLGNSPGHEIGGVPFNNHGV
jgi:hypothetical protein